MEGEKIRVKEYLRNKWRGAGEQGFKVYVGNLPNDARKAEIKEFFSQYGTVTKVVIKKKNPKKNFVYGFVTFTEQEPVDRLKEAKKLRFKGKNVFFRDFNSKGGSKSKNNKSSGDSKKSNESQKRVTAKRNNREGEKRPQEERVHVSPTTGRRIVEDLQLLMNNISMAGHAQQQAARNIRAQDQLQKPAGGDEIYADMFGRRPAQEPSQPQELYNDHSSHQNAPRGHREQDLVFRGSGRNNLIENSDRRTPYHYQGFPQLSAPENDGMFINKLRNYQPGNFTLNPPETNQGSRTFQNNSTTRNQGLNPIAENEATQNRRHPDSARPQVQWNQQHQQNHQLRNYEGPNAGFQRTAIQMENRSKGTNPASGSRDWIHVPETKYFDSNRFIENRYQPRVGGQDQYEMQRGIGFNPNSPDNSFNSLPLNRPQNVLMRHQGAGVRAYRSDDRDAPRPHFWRFFQNAEQCQEFIFGRNGLGVDDDFSEEFGGKEHLKAIKLRTIKMSHHQAGNLRFNPELK